VKEDNMKLLRVMASSALVLGLASVLPGVYASKAVWTVGHGTNYDFNEDDYSAYPGAIQAAVDSANVGDRIMVAQGEYSGATLTKAIELKGSGDGTIIVSGPLHPRYGSYGYRVGFLVANAMGATLRSFKLVGYPSPMVVGVLVVSSDNTTVEKLSFDTPYEGINVFASSHCQITHNTVTGQFGAGFAAINLLSGASWGWRGPVTDNVVAHNTIENGAGGGILLRSYGPSYPVRSNSIEHNKVNNPDGKGIVLNGDSLALFANSIAFNDLRGTGQEIWYSSDLLLTVNTFDRNLGYQPPNEPNRGYRDKH
jgi:hypothetical protein